MRFAVYMRADPSSPFRRVRWEWATHDEAWGFACSVVFLRPQVGVRIVPEVSL